MHTHTVKTISNFHQVDQSTVRRWVAKGRLERSDIGQLIDNIWFFTDDEAKFIASFAKPVAAKTIAEPIYPTVEIISEPAQSNFDTTANLPQSFSLATLRGDMGSISRTVDNPVNQASQALAVMDQLINAMGSDIQNQQAQLQQSQELARQLRFKANQLQQSQTEYRLQSQMLGMMQAQNQDDVAEHLGKLNGLGGSGS
jgi:hypothetical protein